MKLKRNRKPTSSLDQSGDWLEAEELRQEQQQQQPSFVQFDPTSQKHQNPRVTLTGPTSIRISVAAVSDHAKPSMRPRRRTTIAPNPRFQPFLDVVTRRASKEAASVIDPRISREAIYQHPTRPDILLVSPPCWPCSRLGTVCNRASGRCGQCVSFGDRCTREGHWHFFHAPTGKSIPWDKISPVQIINKQTPFEKSTRKGTAPAEIAPKAIAARLIAPKQVPTKNVVRKDVVHKDVALKEIAPKDLDPIKTVSKDVDLDRISPAVVSPTNAISIPKDFIQKHDVQKQDVQNRKRVPPDEIDPETVKSIKVDSKRLREDSDEHRIPRRKCLFWASSINDMRQCDPYFPPKGASIGISRSGTITALLLERHRCEKYPQQSCLVANLPADSAAFESLQMACTAGIGLRVYYLFNDPGKPYRVVNNSVVTLKVMFWRMCSISSVERRDDSSAKLTLIWNQNQLTAIEKEVSTHTTLGIAGLSPHDMSEQTLQGFRCSVCGKANRKLNWEVVSCLHCSASFSLANKDIEKSLSRRRKMELSFTGSRSDLGKANMILTDDGLTKRSVSTFTDGTRICTYYIAESSTNVRSDAGTKVLPEKCALHHVLRPGRSDEVSVEALATPTIPFERLSPTVEAELRVQGYALGFETQNRSICASIAAQQHPFSSASREVVSHIARLRESLQLANTASHEIDQPGKPIGCLFLLLQNGRLRINSSFYSANSAHFGILCLSRSTNVSIRRDRSADRVANFAADRTQKDVSLGTFVMQSQDAVVGRTELLETVELELTSRGVSLWAIAHFSVADSTLINDLPSSQGLYK